MKSQILCALIVAAGCLATLAQADYIVNVDFNGQGGTYGPNPTYQGIGAAGGGTTWNGILAHGTVPLTLGASNMLDSNGNATTVGFSLTGVGGDCTGAKVTTDPTSIYALMGDYTYQGGSYTGYSGTYSFSGLGANATSADVYLYADSQCAQYAGASNNYLLYQSAIYDGETWLGNIYMATTPVTGGTVSGELSPGGNQISDGMIIYVHETVVPEPGTLVLFGTIGLVCGTWRKRK